MKILVTGATGLIGNYVIRRLLSQNHEVVATSTNEEKARRMDWFPEVNYREFDISTIHSFHAAGQNLFEYFHKPDRIIHIAWKDSNLHESLVHFESNLLTHYAFLKTLIDGGITDVTVTGTSLEYGYQSGCLDESVVADPVVPYALAKYTLLKLLQQVQKKSSFHLKWVRFFNVHGTRQHTNSLLYQLDQAVTNKQPVFNMSGGEQVRDFLPVEKAADHLVKIADQNNYTGVINCCSGIPVKVRDFVEDYFRSRNHTIRLNTGYYPYKDYEPMVFYGNNEKLLKILSQ